MKIRLLFLSVLACFVIRPNNETTHVINNSKTSVHVNYDLPIYSRADTKIKPIKSQQELQDLLYEAILTNSTQEIIQVIKAGADVNLFKDGKAPLMWATILKKFNSVDTLKRCGAIIPCPKNMLYRAILNDSYDGVKHAIQAGANPNDSNIISGESSTPLGIAVFLTKSKAVQALLECGAIYNRHGGKFKGVALQPLSYALSMGDIKTALVLLKHDKTLEAHKIITEVDVFEYVSHKINPSEIKNLILEFLQELINHDYNINSESGTYDSRNSVVQYKSAWISAIQSEFYFVEILELLMKNGANPNQRIHQGCYWTPLHIAIKANNLSAVKFLIDAGADLTKKASPSVPSRYCTTSPPQTPLSYAKALALQNVENNEIINLLISHRAPL